MLANRTVPRDRRIFGISVLATVFALVALPAGAGELTGGPLFERLGFNLLSGMSTCEAAVNEGTSRGVSCLADRAVNDVFLGAATKLLAEEGKTLFGEHFRVVNRLTYAPAGPASGSGFNGDLDFTIPLSPRASQLPDPGALFLQQGVTRWIDASGLQRNDIRIGAVRRFQLHGGASTDVFGVSTFVQHSLEHGHGRIVAGLDYLGLWGQASFSLFSPTTGWLSGHIDYEERALAGSELSLRLDLTDTVALDGALGRWEAANGLGGWETRRRLGVGWRPHPWINLGAIWNGIGAVDGSGAVRAALVIPLGETRQPARWRGIGILGGGVATVADLWRPVETVGRIKVASRIRSDDESIVTEARVRFLQDAASSGSEIRLEVTLPVPAPRDLRLIVRLVPGKGENPAVPGEDYVNTPIEVTIHEGQTSAVAAVRLKLNSALTRERRLSATVALGA